MKFVFLLFSIFLVTCAIPIPSAETAQVNVTQAPTVAPIVVTYIPRVVAPAPVFTEKQLAEEISQRMQGLIEIIEWNKLGFPIDDDLLEEALHSTNKCACITTAQYANILPMMEECKMKEKAAKENKTNKLDNIKLHIMTGDCFFKKLVGFNNVTRAVNISRIVRDIENTTLSADNIAAAKQDFITCYNNKMPVPHLLFKMQMQNQKNVNALVIDWMTTVMNNGPDMNSKAVEIIQNMRENLVVKKAMICKVAALMMNGCANDELNLELLV